MIEMEILLRKQIQTEKNYNSDHVEIEPGEKNPEDESLFDDKDPNNMNDNRDPVEEPGEKNPNAYNIEEGLPANICGTPDKVNEILEDFYNQFECEDIKSTFQRKFGSKIY